MVQKREVDTEKQVEERLKGRKITRRWRKRKGRRRKRRERGSLQKCQSRVLSPLLTRENVTTTSQRHERDPTSKSKNSDSGDRKREM